MLPEMDMNWTFGRQSAEQPWTSGVSEDDFESLELLGEGSFGKVSLVKKSTGFDKGRLYAMKTMKMEIITKDRKTYQHTMTECRVSAEVGDSPFLVKSHYTFQTDSDLHLVMDFLEGGDLYDLLNQREKFAEEAVKFYTAEIVLGIEYLHKIGVIYRDLKPENILIDSSGHMRITDYGVCKKFHPGQKRKRAYSFCGTPFYMAPEIIRGKGHTTSVDWWSLGIIVYKMLTGTTPFEAEGEESDNFVEVFDRILTQNPEMPKEFSAEVADFITRLLAKEPQKRLGAGKTGVKVIKRHPFFKNINWADMTQKAVIPPYQPPLEGVIFLGAENNHFLPSSARSQDCATSSSETKPKTQTTEIPVGPATPAVVGKIAPRKRELNRSEDGERPTKRPQRLTKSRRSMSQTTATLGHHQRGEERSLSSSGLRSDQATESTMQASKMKDVSQNTGFVSKRTRFMIQDVSPPAKLVEPKKE
ncbi:ribosomal protein S6 kinase alpha-5-like isoform X2 [Zootermopsis nevadensis]|uniref:ribosomal protein S6 kinase alpha-5-like isoform X2 n=1 Tax=Zootermopsis nevadensis TaxID=136037 RepID=UPI000B8EE0BE|nr:ribosomal protein S6 kinase alpha-5-like isoform X2 [Zootermopsis nevadensis]